jgi:hypothetical protein
MDVKEKQRTVIEFLLFEGGPGNKIAQPLHNMYGQDAPKVTGNCENWNKSLTTIFSQGSTPHF